MERPDESRKPAVTIAAGFALLALVIGGLELSGIGTQRHSPQQQVTTTPAEGLEQARLHRQNHEYGEAEAICRSILQREPGNIEVKRLLASVLFRQDKIEETAFIVKGISDELRASATK